MLIFGHSKSKILLFVANCQLRDSESRLRMICMTAFFLHKFGSDLDQK